MLRPYCPPPPIPCPPPFTPSVCEIYNMRLKFVIALFIATSLVLAGVFYFSQSRSPVAVADVVAPTLETTPQNVIPSTALPPLLPASIPVATLTPAQRQAAIDTELAQLREDSMSDNPADLTNLLAGLTSPENEIREAAIQALEQFGDTNAIPALQATAANATDPKEQAELLAAANFIALPSVDFSPPATPQTAEEIAAREAEIAQFKAEKQAALQKHERGHKTNSPADSTAPNQNSLSPNN